MRRDDSARRSARKRQRMTLAILVLLALLGPAAQASASTVRGRLYRLTPQGIVPASGIPVNVHNPSLGASGFAHSDAQGMYQLFNLPPGVYTLQIWVYPKKPIAFQITVYNRPFTDIAPIQMP